MTKPDVAVRERPIIFSAPMIRAILEGRKTQTRRVIKNACIYGLTDEHVCSYHTGNEDEKWCAIEGDPRVPQLGLHGRGGREHLLADSIRWLWEKGARGLVCLERPSSKKQIPMRIALPPQRKNYKIGSSPRLHVVSREATNAKPPSEASGREHAKQQAVQSSMGNAGGKLAGPQSPRAGKRGRKASNGKAQRFGPRTYPLGNQEGALLGQACGEGARALAGYNLRIAPFQIGTRLWVRETWYCDVPDDEPCPATRSENTYYRADGECCDQIPECECRDPSVGKPRWKSPRYMPRWASRILLEITDVRVERVQEITDDDAEAEGIPDHREDCRITSPVYNDEGVCVEPGYCSCGGYSDSESFALLWDSINAKRGFGWDVNPWVWVLTFRRLKT